MYKQCLGIFLLLAGAPLAFNASPESIHGKWHNGRVSSIQYKNAYTNAPAPTNGSSFAWEFREDGTYSFTGLMQSVMYQCTTSVFSNETGKYTVEGDVVSLKPEKNPYKMTNNCAPSSNKEAPGKIIDRSYRFKVDASRLELVASDGGVMTYARSK